MSAEGTMLYEVGLHKGKKFDYLFDFGDSWRFELKLREITEGNVQEPEVIEAINEAPEQYPGFDLW